MNTQRIFLSWSVADSPSHQVAQILYQYLPLLHDAWEPFLSSESIKAGVMWSNELFSELEGSNFGVLCMTKESRLSEWLLFEAGALAKAFTSARVVPLLIDLTPDDLPRPLRAFQACGIDEQGFQRLIETLAEASEMPEDTARIINSRFAVYWKDIRESLRKTQKATERATRTKAAASHKPNMEEQMREVIEYCRNFERRLEILTRKDAPPVPQVPTPFRVTIDSAASDSPPTNIDTTQTNQG